MLVSQVNLFNYTHLAPYAEYFLSSKITKQ
jgi:hypothetical protein